MIISKVYMLMLIGIISLSQKSSAQTALDSITNLKNFLALTQKGPWQQTHKKAGVRLGYRDLKLGDSLEVRELIASFQVGVTPKKIMPYIKDPDKIASWNSAVAKTTLLEATEFEWVSHTLYAIPFPFTKQDMVARYSVSASEQTTHIDVCSIPGYMAALEKVKRERYQWAEWTIEPMKTGGTKITFSAVSLSNSSIPRFLKDPVVRRKLLQAFTQLKYILEHESTP